MRKVTLAMAMLPLLASAPVLAASVSSQEKAIYLAQAGDPGMSQFAQQVCTIARQNAQSYSRILQLRDKMLKIQRDNEARFQALERDAEAHRIMSASARPQSLTMPCAVMAASLARVAAIRVPACSRNWSAT